MLCFFVQFYFLCTQNKCHVIFTPVFAWRSVQFNIRHELNRKIYNLDYNKILCSLLLLHMQISHAVRQQCGSGSGPMQNHETTDISLFIYLSTVHVTVKNAARDNTKKKKENHQLVGCFLERFPCSSVCAFDLIIMSLIFIKKNFTVYNRTLVQNSQLQRNNHKKRAMESVLFFLLIIHKFYV